MSRPTQRAAIDVDVAQFQRLPLDGQAVGLMILFCLIIGLQQVAIKVALDDISALAQISIRSIIAAVLVMMVARWRGIELWVPRQFGPGLVVGIGFTLEYVFVAVGLNYTYAAHMSVFLYTAPVFAAIGLHLFVPGEQLGARHWLGIFVAFAGLVAAIAPNADVSMEILWGDALGVCAGLSWASTTIALRTSVLSDAPPIRTVAYQLLVAAMLLLPAAGFLGDLGTIHMTPIAWLSMSFQSLAVSVAALLLWFWLLRRYLASRLGVFAFLSPIFGVVFGVLLLGDPITINFAIGGVAILVGLLLVNSPTHKKATSS